MTQIFLGYPPEHIKNWIIGHSKPVGNPKTKITFTDRSSQEFDWSGYIDQQTMITDGLYNGNEWVKEPKTVEIGTNVTSIGTGLFWNCSGLTSVTIPDSVTSIGGSAFGGCSGLTSLTIPDSVTSIYIGAFASCQQLMSVTFSGKNKATVQGMAEYSWYLNSGCVIHCTDGDITI